jgi:chorismate dehydratase
MEKPLIAASSYLNAAPLCYSFIKGKQAGACRFISDAAPARCSEMLRERVADAALIPVIEYQRITGLKVVRGSCVSSRDEVWSVVLASKTPMELVRSVALDTSSRTSAALVQIILRRFYGVRARFRPSPPQIETMLENNDAALVIGDPAILIDRSSLRVYDLASEWKKHTGLPFVFAFWAVRPESESWRDHRVDFRAAKDEGLERIEEIAETYARTLGLERERLLEYLTRNICYDLDEESLRGMKLYYELAHETGLLEEVRPLEFWE